MISLKISNCHVLCYPVHSVTHNYSSNGDFILYPEFLYNNANNCYHKEFYIRITKYIKLLLLYIEYNCTYIKFRLLKQHSSTFKVDQIALNDCSLVKMVTGFIASIKERGIDMLST